MTETPGSGQSTDRSIAELKALHAAALALSEQLDPETVLERIVEQAAALVARSFGYLYIADEAAGQLVQRVGQGPFAPLVGSTMARDVGLAGLVWRRASPRSRTTTRTGSNGGSGSETPCRRRCSGCRWWFAVGRSE